MSERQKRYTAQEMREAAGRVVSELYTNPFADMLRQAADAEEELLQLKASKERWMQYQETAAGERNACIDELRKKDAEIAQLKARLEAVVKECAQSRWKWQSTERTVAEKIQHNTAIDAILRAARGESDSNNSSSYTDDIYNS